jgi:hypothetical protein
MDLYFTQSHYWTKSVASKYKKEISSPEEGCDNMFIIHLNHR